MGGVLQAQIMNIDALDVASPLGATNGITDRTSRSETEIFKRSFHIHDCIWRSVLFVSPVKDSVERILKRTETIPNIFVRICSHVSVSLT